MSLLIHKSPIELWLKEVKRAEESCAILLIEDLEAYLVFLLMRFTNKPEVVTELVATRFLESIHQGGESRQAGFQYVGDQCLILTGLFPHMAEKRHVDLSYFVKLGKTSYSQISDKSDDLYSLLSHQFVLLMDILQSLRQYSKYCPDLLPLEAYDLWQATGSKRSFNILQSYRQHKL